MLKLCEERHWCHQLRLRPWLLLQIIHCLASCLLTLAAKQLVMTIAGLGQLWGSHCQIPSESLRIPTFVCFEMDAGVAACLRK